MVGQQANNLASHYYSQGYRRAKVLTEIFVVVYHFITARAPQINQPQAFPSILLDSLHNTTLYSMF
jgi:hypothetical protein